MRPTASAMRLAPMPRPAITSTFESVGSSACGGAVVLLMGTRSGLSCGVWLTADSCPDDFVAVNRQLQTGSLGLVDEL
eukprot:2494398-Prymnesium_polylepis.1